MQSINILFFCFRKTIPHKYEIEKTAIDLRKTELNQALMYCLLLIYIHNLPRLQSFGYTSSNTRNRGKMNSAFYFTQLPLNVICSFVIVTHVLLFIALIRPLKVFKKFCNLSRWKPGMLRSYYNLFMWTLQRIKYIGSFLIFGVQSYLNQFLQFLKSQ